jgi:hypothetical protein
MSEKPIKATSGAVVVVAVVVVWAVSDAGLLAEVVARGNKNCAFATKWNGSKRPKRAVKRMFKELSKTLQSKDSYTKTNEDPLLIIQN